MTECKEYACILTQVPSLMPALKEEWFRPFLRRQQRATNINQVGLRRPPQDGSEVSASVSRRATTLSKTALHRRSERDSGEPTPFLKHHSFHFYRFKDLL